MIKKILEKYSFPAFLLFVVILLFISNYQPGTYLLGWDNLQTELNPLLAVKRATHAVWQEYQSLGLTSGMAHAADIIRAIFMFGLSVLLPQPVMRYVFHLLMVYVGGLGFYFLLNYLGLSKGKRGLAFIGACFYMLNLGTVQIFSLPFEPFSAFFAFLPWEILVFLKFIYAERITPKHVFNLVLVNLLATPQAYLQTLFVVYFICLAFFAFGLLFEKKEKKKLFKRYAIAFGMIILVNLFWLLPQVYFVRTSLSVVKESKINQQATDIVSRQNIEKGTLRSFSRLEGFYYDLQNVKGESIFKPWKDYHSNIFITIITYIPFAFLLAGLLKKHKSHYGFVSIFVLTSLLLLSSTRAVSYFNSLIFSHSFIKQIFRSPFTKFIVPYSLVYSYLFVSGLEVFYNWLKKKSPNIKKANLNIVFTSVASAFLIVYSLPAFLGHYFSDSMKVAMPDSYLETIDYFKAQDKNKRIGLLPDYTHWGWFSHEWGYDGSGFIWYGVEQPIISRTFDVWSLESESYFWEIKYAIESKNASLFENVLDKYGIDYLIYEKSLNPVSSVEEGMQYDQIDWILERTDKVVKVKGFEELDILEVAHEHEIDKFVSLAENTPEVEPVVKVTNLDEAYVDVGVYKSAGGEADFIYPFLDLTTQTNIFGKRWEISEDENNFYFKVDLGGYDLDKYILADSTVEKEAKVFLGQEVVSYDFIIDKYLEGETLVVKVQKEVIESYDPTYVSVDNCSGKGDIRVEKRGTTLKVYSIDRGMACFGYASSLLDHWNGYLVKLHSNNNKGKELFFYIFGNKERRQSKLETNLKGGVEYFVLNPGYYYDDGYFFSFQNPSYKLIPSENELDLLEVYLLPFEYLKDVKLVNKGLVSVEKAEFKDGFEVEKDKYYAYKVSFDNGVGSDLILYQAYDSGWGAYVVGSDNYLARSMPFVFGSKLEDHFIINNWSNGWALPEMGESDYVVLFFWPQMLEYIGIAAFLLIWNGAILLAFYKKDRAKRD